MPPSAWPASKYRPSGGCVTTRCRCPMPAKWKSTSSKNSGCAEVISQALLDLDGLIHACLPVAGRRQQGDVRSAGGDEGQQPGGNFVGGAGRGDVLESVVRQSIQTLHFLG